MSKIKLFIFLFILFFSENINAKTVGNYVGIDFIKTALRFSDKRTIYETNEIEKSIQSVPYPSYSFGLKYNYAINYRGIFVSPGLIYEKNNNKSYYNSDGNARSSLKKYGKSYSQINQRFGAKIDLGFDINNDLSIYGTMGYAINYYTTLDSLYEDQYFNYYAPVDDSPVYKVSDNPWKLNKDKKWAPFFGGGFRIKLFRNWLLNGEYNYTKFIVNTKSQQQKVFNDQGNQDQRKETTKKLFKNNIQILKLGINYNF